MEFLQVDQLTQTKKHLSYLDVLFPKEKQVACSNDYFQMKLGKTCWRMGNIPVLYLRKEHYIEIGYIIGLIAIWKNFLENRRVYNLENVCWEVATLTHTSIAI